MTGESVPNSVHSGSTEVGVLSSQSAVERHMRAALLYARRILGESLGLRFDPGFDARVVGSTLTAPASPQAVRDAQAIVIEREIARCAPSLRAFVGCRSAALLIDLGARPVLSERAAHEVDVLEAGLRWGARPLPRSDRLDGGGRR